MWKRNLLENINFEDIKGEARLCRCVFKIYESVLFLALKTEINITHYILGKRKVHLGKIKLPFRPKRDGGQSIQSMQNKLFHM
jgi:hypothetical protein